MIGGLAAGGQPGLHGAFKRSRVFQSKAAFSIFALAVALVPGVILCQALGAAAIRVSLILLGAKSTAALAC